MQIIPQMQKLFELLPFGHWRSKPLVDHLQQVTTHDKYNEVSISQPIGARHKCFGYLNKKTFSSIIEPTSILLVVKLKIDLKNCAAVLNFSLNRK